MERLEERLTGGESQSLHICLECCLLCACNDCLREPEAKSIQGWTWIVSGMDSVDSRQITKVVELLQRKWTVQVQSEMREGPVRLGQLKRRSRVCKPDCYRATWAMPSRR